MLEEKIVDEETSDRFQHVVDIIRKWLCRNGLFFRQAFAERILESTKNVSYFDYVKVKDFEERVKEGGMNLLTGEDLKSIKEVGRMQQSENPEWVPVLYMERQLDLAEMEKRPVSTKFLNYEILDS